MRSTNMGAVNTGALLVLSCVASSTYAALLETASGAGANIADVINELVSFAFSANYEADRVADDAIPMGRVVYAERRSSSDWLLSVEMLRVKPTGSSAVAFRPLAVVQLPYRSGATVTLGKPIIADQTGSVYTNADDSGSNADGLGCVFGKDATALTVDVLV